MGEKVIDKVPTLQGLPQQSGIGTNAGVSGRPQTKDATESARSSQFGEVFQQIQAKYGEKAKPQREAKKTLDKDDFLKIMIAQMKNQDPSSPFKAEQMATEMAQFASVEQLHNMNSSLTKLSGQNRPLEHLTMTNLIGKTVTISRDRFPHSQGQTENLKFGMPKNAAQVKIAIVSDKGEIEYEKELGPQTKGETSFNWDGRKTNTLLANSGNFMLRVEAVDDRGQVIDINPQSKARVIGVSFEQGEPVFLVGDAAHQDKVTFENITKVEAESLSSGAQSKSAAVPISAPQQESEAQSHSRVIPIEALTGLSPAVGAAVASASAPQAPMAPAAPSASSPLSASSASSAIFPESLEKGFPNGLQDLEINQNQNGKGGEQR